jgi:hypothetical protein
MRSRACITSLFLIERTWAHSRFRDGQVMHKNQSIVEMPLAERMDELLERFGSWRLLAALVRANWRRRQIRNLASHLSPQLRRDIGLPEEEVIYPRRLTALDMSLWHIRK